MIGNNKMTWRAMIDNQSDMKCLGEFSYTNNLAKIIMVTDPNLLIFDIDGIHKAELLDEFNQLKRVNPNIKVVVFASSMEEMDLLKFIEAGVDSFILKKNSFEQSLPGVIRSIMNNQFILPYEITHSLMSRIIELQMTNKDLFVQKLFKNSIFLTRRETDVAYFMKQGLKNGDIADRLQINKNTVKVHVSHIYSKLKNKKRNEVVTYFQEMFC
ncbi:DNA-binding response regulator [Virgibacillus byunsanensis]|uniref:DNA-binding response regulator n=1 Tax=Virgibacillus byunsanensis TaxID=570945 RepID=A0ABW3LGK1_9BACI